MKNDNEKAPCAMIDENVFGLANCLPDESVCALFRAMCKFVKDGTVTEFKGMNNADMLEILFGMFKKSVEHGWETYGSRSKGGSKGGFKKNFLKLKLGSDEEFEELWDSCGGDTQKVKSEIEKLSERRSSGSGVTLKRASYS